MPSATAQARPFDELIEPAADHPRCIPHQPTSLPAQLREHLENGFGICPHLDCPHLTDDPLRVSEFEAPADESSGPTGFDCSQCGSL